jgi:hypothetical protein
LAESTVVSVKPRRNRHAFGIEAPSLDHAPKEIADSIDRMLVSDNTA